MWPPRRRPRLGTQPGSRSPECMAREIAGSKNRKRDSVIRALGSTFLAAQGISSDMASEQGSTFVRVVCRNSLGCKFASEAEAAAVAQVPRDRGRRTSCLPSPEQLDDGPSQRSDEGATATARTQRPAADDEHLHPHFERRRYEIRCAVGRDSGRSWTERRKQRACCESASPCELRRRLVAGVRFELTTFGL